MCRPAHTTDGEGNPDPRIVVVDAADHPAGAMRPIYPDLEDFPRHIGACALLVGGYEASAHVLSAPRSWVEGREGGAYA